MVAEGMRGVLPAGRLRASTESTGDGAVRSLQHEHTQDPGGLLQVRRAAAVRRVASVPRRRFQS